MIFDGIDYTGTIYEDYVNQFNEVVSYGDSCYDFERYVNFIREVAPPGLFTYGDFLRMNRIICQLIDDDMLNEFYLNPEGKRKLFHLFYQLYMCTLKIEKEVSR